MKKNNTILTLFIVLSALFTACKKDGTLIQTPEFGKLLLNLTVADNTGPLLVRVDGVTVDTVENGIIGINMETGKRRISIVDEQAKVMLDTTLAIEVRKSSTLSGLLIGDKILLDNLDPQLKPQTDSLLVRFVTTDPTLPDLMDIEISLYDFGGTYIPLKNKIIKGIRKDQFSDYIQLPHPNVIDPSFDSTFMFYVIEGYDATSGGNNRKVMSIEEFNVSYLDYSGDFTFMWVPNNIVSFGISAVPSDGSTTLRNPQLIFQRSVIP